MKSASSIELCTAVAAFLAVSQVNNLQLALKCLYTYKYMGNSCLDIICAALAILWHCGGQLKGLKISFLPSPNALNIVQTM